MMSKKKPFNMSARIGTGPSSNAASGAITLEPGPSQADRFKQSGREEAKLLVKAEAMVVECERRVLRQAFLIEELRAGGVATIEAEKSLARLEAAVIDQRAQRDVALAKANGV